MRIEAIILRKTIIPIILASMTLAGTFSLNVPAYADGGQSSTMAQVGSVNWTGNSSFELMNIQMIPEQEGQLLTFTITIHNNASRELDFNDVWIRLKDRSGKSYPVKLNPQDINMKKIQPQSSQDLSFYTTVNASTKLHELIFQFFQWDFSQSNYERTIGELTIPEGYTTTVPAGASHVIHINDVRIKSQISKIETKSNGRYILPTVYLNMENAGSYQVTVPTFTFAIRTSDGRVHPLEAKDAKDMTISPNDAKELLFSGSIPVSVDTDNWELVVTSLDSDLKLHMPVATFQLPDETKQELKTIGHEYTISNDDGNYTTQLNDLQRLPLNDLDMLSANVTLSNKGDQSLPIPELTGYFLLDGGVKVEAEMIRMAKTIGIGSGDHIDVQFVGGIPYTYAFSDLKLVIQQKESDSKLQDLLTFSDLKEQQTTPYIRKLEAHTISDPGRRTRYAIYGSSVYKGSSSDLFTAQIRVENLEKRFSSLPKLVAYFRSKDGSIFPATLDEVNQKISPAGKAQLNAWTQLPKDYPTQELDLVLGESIQSESEVETAVSSTDVMYVKPTAYWVPEISKDIKLLLKEITLYPYNLSLSRISTSISGNMQGISELTLKFNYELTKDLAAETNVEGHKLVLAFEDYNGKTSFERAYDAKDFEPKAMDDDQSGQKRLLIGMHEGFHIDISEKDLIYQQQFLKKYTLKIYDEFHGHRRLLGSQELDWFTTTD
jgi:hypothetical protein